MAYRSIQPGQSLQFSFVASTPGVFIYHCGTPPVLDHMANTATTCQLLMADDDEDDCLLTREALEESGLLNPLYIVQDGGELMDYLYRRGAYANSVDAPRPGVILLDLNMPRVDGREALQELKADADLRRIPVVVLTTSQAEEDIVRCYELGASSYITKPVTFQGLVTALRTLGHYWFEIVQLPVD